MTVKLLQGDALTVLRTLPTASVHCCVTSPPYFGLRDYGLPPTIWDDPGDCVHVWDTSIRPGQSGGNGRTSTLTKGGDRRKGDHENYGAFPATTSACCQRCSAWRSSLGLEPQVGMYVSHLVQVFREVRRVLRPDGTCWIVIGDSYAASGWKNQGRGSPTLNDGQADFACRQAQHGLGSGTTPGVPAKNLLGVPWRLAFALQADGWVLRQEMTWVKVAPMPESVQDRPTSATEKVFLLAPQGRYYFDMDAVKTPAVCTPRPESSRWNGEAKHQQDGRQRGKTGLGFNRPEAGASMRNYLLLGPEPFSSRGLGVDTDHFAVMPTALVEPCVLAGTSQHGCCSHCLAPYRRVLARGARPLVGVDLPLTSRRSADGSAASPHGTGSALRVSNSANDAQWRAGHPDHPTGWAPTCPHTDAPVVPCTVLDPFCGAGTVALVADRLGRDSLGIDLNADYLTLARARLVGDSPLFMQVD